MRHNQLRNDIAFMLEDVCKDVTIEPQLIPLSGEVLASSSITTDGARSDVSARGFWTPMQRAFFDIKVTHLNAPSYRQKDPLVVYRDHEQEKKRKYNSRIINIEHGHFTPLIFSTTGGMGPECSIFIKRLAVKIAEKKNQSYPDVMRVIRTKLRYSILRT